MESTGSVWETLYNSLEERKIPVTLANPLNIKAIASARIKTDKIDARLLAHLLKSDLVAECHVPSKELREIRSLVRHQAGLVRATASLKNRVHVLLDGHGLRCEYSDLFGKRSLEWLRSLNLGEVDGLVLRSSVAQGEVLNSMVADADSEIRGRASIDDEVRLLLSLTGVDVYTPS